MAKVLSFSRYFPKGHPKEGKPTHFVAKMLNALGIDFRTTEYMQLVRDLNKHNPKITEDILRDFFKSLKWSVDDEKIHTIRAKNPKHEKPRWKAGELASPRVWSDTPYASPQIIFAPDTKVKKTYGFVTSKFGLLEHVRPEHSFKIDGELKFFDLVDVETLAYNDGLTWYDFKKWFKLPCDFDGQIIAWKEPNY